MQETSYIKTMFAFWHLWLARNNAMFRNTIVDCASIYWAIETSYTAGLYALHHGHAYYH